MARTSETLNDYLLKKYKRDEWNWGLDWGENWGEIHREIYAPTLTHPADDLIARFQHDHPPYKELVDHLFWRKTILLTGVTPELETLDLSQILTLCQICRKITAYVDGILKIWLDERAPLLDMMASVQRRWENGRLMCNPHMVVRCFLSEKEIIFEIIALLVSNIVKNEVLFF